VANQVMAEQPWYDKFLYGEGRAPLSLGAGIKQIATGGDPLQTNREATARALDYASGGWGTGGAAAGRAGVGFPQSRGAAGRRAGRVRRCCQGPRLHI